MALPPYLVLDVDEVLQARSLSFPDATVSVIRSTVAPSATHGEQQLVTAVTVSGELFEALERLPVQPVMVTSWLENGSVRSFLSQALPARPVLAGAWVPPFPARDSEGYLPWSWKYDIVRELLLREPRPFIWADDDEIIKFQETIEREFPEIPKLLIAPEREIGLTRAHVAAMEHFLAEL